MPLQREDRSGFINLWRPSRMGRAAAFANGGLLVALGILFGLVVPATSDVPPSVPVLGAMFAGSGLFAVYSIGFRMRIVLTPVELEIVNPIAHYRVPLTSICSVNPGYSGMRVEARSGQRQQVYFAWAVQKSNAARCLGRRVRADAVAEEILRAVAAAHDAAHDAARDTQPR